MKNQSTNELLLGKHTDYPEEYSPQVLQAIPRALARESLPFGLNVGKGFDFWHVFEVSWLDAFGKPQVAIARLSIPADSPNIVESKSLKLYFNSLNFKSFDSKNDVVATVKKDVGHTVRAIIAVEFFAVENFHVSSVEQAVCIDNETLQETSFEIDAKVQAGKRIDLLKATGHTMVSERLVSHLLRSNCPVTNQPDWGTVLVEYEGRTIDKAALLTYICAYRRHNGFHEQCVEQIYADIWTKIRPKRLKVQAWYTRRGGIDINPCRVSDNDMKVVASRLARQ